MEEIDQVISTTSSQETNESEEVVAPELVPVDTLKRASKEAQQARHKLQQERAKAAELEAQLHQIKQAQLEQQGKYKEMYEQQAQQAKVAQQELENLQKKVVTEKVSSSFMMAAKDAGCVDPETLWRVAETENLEVDDNLKVRPDSLQAALQKAKDKLPYMFRSEKPNVADTNPGQVTPAPAKSVQEMNQQELKQYMEANKDLIKKQFENF